MENFEDQDRDAEGHVDQPAASRKGRSLWPFPRRNRLWWQAGGLSLLLLVLLVIALGFDGGLFSPTTSRLPTNPGARNSSALLTAQSSDFACLVDTTWSPDSKQVAVLGYRQQCAIDEAESGLVTIYDARSARQVGQVQPDGPILRAITPRSSGHAVIHYHNILWSPDGGRWGITFVVVLSPETALDGVLLIDTHGTHAQVLLQPDMNYSYLVWNLQDGQLVQFGSVPSLDSGWTTTAVPALTYYWGANGTLIPGAKLSSTTVLPAPPLGPIGNADGGASFSIWQAGMANLTTQNGNGPVHVPGVYSWSTGFAAWSPDGRYLAQDLYLTARLSVPGQPPVSRQTLTDFQMEQLPLLPVRDLGLKQILQTFLVPADTTGTGGVVVSWKPDGRVVAANGAGSTMDLYDTSTGRHLVSLQALPAISAVSDLFSSVIARWSPDGSHLLIAGPDWGTATLWDSGQLPT